MKYYWDSGDLPHNICIDTVQLTIDAIHSDVLMWMLRGEGNWDSGSRYELTPGVLHWLLDNVGDDNWDIERYSTYSLHLLFRHQRHATLFKLTWS